MPKINKNCPCGSGQGYRECCKPFHKGNKHPKTAESLMRARYCAYAKGLRDFIRDTWHPSTRPGNLLLDSSTRWTGLNIHSTTGGTETEVTGTVAFTAHYNNNGSPGSLMENSEFVKEEGRWFYLKGTFSS